MELTINENQIKLSGKCNVLSGLKNDKEYDLTISNAQVVKIEEDPLGNGTYNRVAKLKISELSEVNIISEKEIIKSKPKIKTQSQALRWKIEQKWQDTGSDLDKEDFYIKEMSRIITEY
jgi:hypothetical protein